MRSLLKYTACLTLAVLVASAPAFAGENATKEEAVAMVKKVVAAIKADGADKTYTDITAKDAKYVDRDLYPVVYDVDGKCLSHGSNAKLVGKDLLDVQDADGKYFVKERVEKAKAGPSFWQDYKFSNPQTKKIEPKEAYCETLDKTIVCAGVYKPEK